MDSVTFVQRLMDLPDLDFDEWSPRKSGKQTKAKSEMPTRDGVLRREVQEAFEDVAIDLSGCVGFGCR